MQKASSAAAQVIAAAQVWQGTVHTEPPEGPEQVTVTAPGYDRRREYGE